MSGTQQPDLVPNRVLVSSTTLESGTSQELPTARENVSKTGPTLRGGSHAAAEPDPRGLYDNRHESFSSDDPTAHSPYYGINDILKEVGVPVNRTQETLIDIPEEDITYKDIAEFIKGSNTMVKVRPMLVSFGGLPKRGKSTALKQFLANYVQECPEGEFVITNKSTNHVPIGITHYELVADGTNPLTNFILSEAMKNSCFAYGILSCFKNILTTENRVPVLTAAGDYPKHFTDESLDDHFLRKCTRFFSKPLFCSKGTESTHFASGLVHSVPKSLTLINIWDHSIRNTVRHLLSALHGHLYNHHMFLFLDLLEDLEKIDEPPEIQDIDRDEAVFMTWRPRLHYLLRSCWSTKEKGNDKRKRSCTIFAKIKGEYTKDTKEKIAQLENLIKPAAKHIGVDRLLENRIEHLNLEADLKLIYQKFKSIARKTPPEEIPLAWVFLRDWFYHAKQIFVPRVKLKEKAEACGMNDDSLYKFCKFYTSFGSIIDLSLANPQYDYVIIKPIDFLKKLDEFMNPNSVSLEKYPTIKLGVIPQQFIKEISGEENWAAFMDSLVSLDLVTYVTTGMLEMPPSSSINPDEQHCYASLSCEGPLEENVDPTSVHLITNIDTPHFFKQVAFAKKFLDLCKDYQPKLVPCQKVNQLVLKVLNTIVTLTFHSPAIKIHFNCEDSKICLAVIKTFNAIAEEALLKDIQVKYKFVQLCAKKDVPNIESILFSRYHVLPHEGDCKECDAAGRDDGLKKVWNEALKKAPVPSKCKPSGEIGRSELCYVAEKLHSYCINEKEWELFAKRLVPDDESRFKMNNLPADKFLEKTLFTWYDEVYKKKNDGPEPRRALAEIIAEKGEEISHERDEPAENVQAKFEKLAKKIDLYWRPQGIKSSGRSSPMATSSSGDHHDTCQQTSFKAFAAQQSKESKPSLSKDEDGSDDDSTCPSSASDEAQYGIGSITKPIGVSVRYHDHRRYSTVSQNDITYNYTSIGDLIKDQNIKVQVCPILLSFSGLPDSGKSDILKKFLKKYVQKCPHGYVPITPKKGKSKAGITQYELIADGSDTLVHFTLSEAMKESYFTYGLLSAFKNILVSQEKVPVLENIAENPHYFKDNDLENFFLQMHRYLCSQNTIPKCADDTATAALGLQHSLPSSLILLNIWDHSISNVVRHLLSALQGHLYNHHMFLFLDLERDLDNLDEPPEIAKPGRDGAVFMKWRPRLHYLLRSAWATDQREGDRRRTCILFAKSSKTFDCDTKLHGLEDYIRPVAKQIGVAKLVDKEIKVVNKDEDRKHIFHKVQYIASYKPTKSIPLSWLFLRSLFYVSNKIIISKDELKLKASECGISLLAGDDSLSEFCKFYTSFGSIIDLSLAYPEYKYAIVKPVKFLKLLSQLLYPNDEVLKQYPTMKFGILPESYCHSILGDDNWLFMDALVCLQLATRITGGSLELPTGYSIEPMSMNYYISLCCRDDPITEVDPNAIHLITNIDTPHIFKQVTVAKKLLESMNELKPKLLPSTSINELIIKVFIKSKYITVNFTFHSPIIKIHFSEPNSIVCSYVIKTFIEIVRNAYKANGIKAKYKYVRMCAKSADIPNVQSLLSSLYHTLPYDGHCSDCTIAGKNNTLLEVWNETLRDYPIPDEFKPKGDIESEELSHIIKKMGPNLIDAAVFAEAFIPNYKEQPQFHHLTGDRLMNEILFSWYENIRLNKNGGPEPRRALAEKLSNLGEKVASTDNDPQKIKVLFERLAKRIDAYWKFKTYKQLTKDDIPKLAVALQPIEDEWYKLGESLGIDESLKEILKEKKREKSLIESLLLAWINEKKEVTLSLLENGLKTIGREELLPGLQDFKVSSFLSAPLKPNTKDKKVQFDYLIPLMDRLDSLSDIHIAEKKLFHIQGDAPQLINWEQFGLRIGVSKGSFSHSETVDAAVIGLVGGHFKFPVNTKLVSGIYAFSTSKPLLQPLRLDIQHCVDLKREDQVKRLKFAIAPINTSSLPYEFKIVEGGSFKIGSWYGSIDRDKFCFVCIVSEINGPGAGGSQSGGEDQGSDDDDDDDDEKRGSSSSGAGKQLSAVGEGQGHQQQESQENTEKKRISSTDSAATVNNLVEKSQTDQTAQCTAGNVEGMTHAGLIYYEEKKVDDLITFTAVKKLDLLIKYIKKNLNNLEIGQDFSFSFKSGYDYIELTFNEPQKKPFDGWTIDPHKEPCRLYKNDIDKFGEDDDSVPASCLISVYGSPTAVPILHYGVHIIGVIHPVILYIRRTLRTIASLPYSSDQLKSCSSVFKDKPSISIVSSNIDAKIACKVIQDNISLFKGQTFLLNYLVDEMSQEGIISDRERIHITDRSRGDTVDTRMNEVLDILKQTIKVKGDTFTTFIKILRNHGAQRVTIIADKLQTDYEAAVQQNT